MARPQQLRTAPSCVRRSVAAASTGFRQRFGRVCFESARYQIGLIIVASAALFTSTVGVATASGQALTLQQRDRLPVVSADFTDISVTHAVDAVLKSSSLRYRLETTAASVGEATTLRKVTFHNLRIDIALSALLLSTDLWWHSDGMTIVVDLVPITISTGEEPPVMLLKHILDKERCDFVMVGPTDIGTKMSLHVFRAPFQETLDRVTAAAVNAGYRIYWRGRVCCVTRPEFETLKQRSELLVRASFTDCTVSDAIDNITGACFGGCVYPSGILNPSISFRGEARFLYLVFAVLRRIPGNDGLVKVTGNGTPGYVFCVHPPVTHEVRSPSLH